MPSGRLIEEECLSEKNECPPGDPHASLRTPPEVTIEEVLEDVKQDIIKTERNDSEEGGDPLPLTEDALTEIEVKTEAPRP